MKTTKLYALLIGPSIIISVALLLTSMQLEEADWWRDFTLSLATTFIGIPVTLLLVELVVDRHEHKATIRIRERVRESVNNCVAEMWFIIDLYEFEKPEGYFLRRQTLESLEKYKNKNRSAMFRVIADNDSVRIPHMIKYEDNFIDRVTNVARTISINIGDLVETVGDHLGVSERIAINTLIMSSKDLVKSVEGTRNFDSESESLSLAEGLAKSLNKQSMDRELIIHFRNFMLELADWDDRFGR